MLLNNRYPTLACMGCRFVVVFSCAVLGYLAHSPQASGQGLLGKRFVGSSFVMARPNDPLLQDIDDWVVGVGIIGNLPLTETFDINVALGTGWFDGSTIVGSVPIAFDSDVTSFSTTIIKHFLPEGRIDPFAGIGMGYTKINLEVSSGTVSTSSSDDDVGLDWVAGLEWRITDKWALRPMISGDDSLDGFDFGDILVENLFVETQVIYWWNERWFSGFTIGSDFDDTEVALEFLLGYGRW